MSAISNGIYPKRHLKSTLAEWNVFNNEENIFCTEDNLQQSLIILNEEFESFGMTPVTVQCNVQTLSSFKKLSVKLINAAWNFIHKHKSLMHAHDQLTDSNHRTANDNVHLKNQVKRLKEDIQKKEHLLHEAQEKERRLKVQYENVSRDLKHEKEEVRKLKKQAQSKDVQHEHEVRRIMQNGQKLQEQLQKSAGTFVPRNKVLQKMQENHEKELTSYKQTICHLEENSRQMLEEINNLKEALDLFRTGTDLHMEACGIWNTDFNTKSD